MGWDVALLGRGFVFIPKAGFEISGGDGWDGEEEGVRGGVVCCFGRVGGGKDGWMDGWMDRSGIDGGGGGRLGLGWGESEGGFFGSFTGLR